MKTVTIRVSADKLRQALVEAIDKRSSDFFDYYPELRPLDKAKPGTVRFEIVEDGAAPSIDLGITSAPVAPLSLPREPTQAMLAATEGMDSNTIVHPETARAIWIAMFDALAREVS